MAKRPTHSRVGKQSEIVDWPADIGPSNILAQLVTFTGNPQHKTYPTPAGPPALKADKAKCWRFPEENWPDLLDALRRAIRAECIGYFRGRFPSRAWVWINDVLHEARLTNPETGDYHGFPLNDSRDYPRPSKHLERAPRVQIPVI